VAQELHSNTCSQQPRAGQDVGHKDAQYHWFFQINREANKYMPVNGRKWHPITDLFTTGEIDRAMTLLIECDKTNEDFILRCYNEVVQPVISRVNAYTGYNNSPASLVYRLETYLKKRVSRY
jgi:hypothetical protein